MIKQKKNQNKQLALLTLKEIFVLNPYKENLDDRVGGKGLDPNLSNLVLEINQEKEESTPRFLLIECNREINSNSISINSLIQLRSLLIEISKDLQSIFMLHNILIF